MNILKSRVTLIVENSSDENSELNILKEQKIYYINRK